MSSDWTCLAEGSRLVRGAWPDSFSGSPPNMDHGDLWKLANRELLDRQDFSLASAEVCDLLGTNRIRMEELEAPQYRPLAEDVRFGFREVKDKHHWEIHFWRE